MMSSRILKGGGYAKGEVVGFLILFENHSWTVLQLIGFFRYAVVAATEMRVNVANSAVVTIG